MKPRAGRLSAVATVREQLATATGSLQQMRRRRRDVVSCDVVQCCDETANVVY